MKVDKFKYLRSTFQKVGPIQTEGEGLQNGSETCYDVRYRDSKKTRWSWRWQR